jgi:hypothetical protein
VTPRGERQAPFNLSIAIDPSFYIASISTLLLGVAAHTENSRIARASIAERGRTPIPGEGFRRKNEGVAMQPRWIVRMQAALLIGIALAWVSLQGHRFWGVEAASAAPASARPAAAARAPGNIRSGYAVGAERCGEAPLAFPKIRIDMRPGYCAGLVASSEDGLVMPRSIVQIPGTRLFVVSDMGAGLRNKVACCASIRQHRKARG